MRVLIVTQYFWPESFRINDLALGLRDRGHEVTVLTGLPNYPEGRLFPGYSLFSRRDDYNGIKIHRVPLITRGKSRGLRLLANYASFAASASVLGPLRCRGEFDAIFVYEPSPITVGIPAAVMKWFKKAPVLFWAQDLWPETLAATGAVKSPWLLRRVDGLVRRIYGHCDRVLVQSNGFIPRVESQGVPPERIEYFPNWAESFFRPVELPADAPERAEMPAGFRIVFAGNIGVSQSFETILDAAARTRDLPEIKWVVLGDGRERERVDQQVYERGLHKTVHLLGRRPVETMPRYFQAADVLLCTLKRDPVFSLTIPSKLQTYLACGRPVLAAIDGEGAEVIRDSGAGLVCPAEDGPALAEHARRLYECGPAERARMGLSGRRYFEQNFERERLLDRLETLLDEVRETAAGNALCGVPADSRDAEGHRGRFLQGQHASPTAGAASPAAQSGHTEDERCAA